MSCVTDRAIDYMEANPERDYTARELCRSLGLETHGPAGSESVGQLDAELGILSMSGLVATKAHGRSNEFVYRYAGGL
jgi:hypothetical protein